MWLRGDPTDSAGMRLLALPNLVLFLASTALLVFAIDHTIGKRPLLLTGLAVALLAWVVLEVLRWFGLIAAYDPTFANWPAAALSVLLLVTPALGAIVVTGQRRNLSVPSRSLANTDAVGPGNSPRPPERKHP